MPTVPVNAPTAAKRPSFSAPPRDETVCTYQISPKIITIWSGAQIIVTSR
jgi:hypothetical protein